MKEIKFSAMISESRRLLRGGTKPEKYCFLSWFCEQVFRLSNGIRTPRNRLWACQSPRETVRNRSNKGGTAEKFVPEADMSQGYVFMEE